MNQFDAWMMNWDDDYEVTKKIIIESQETEKALNKPSVCYHYWVHYVGLKEVYDYCQLCGVKKC